LSYANAKNIYSGCTKPVYYLTIKYIQTGSITKVKNMEPVYSPVFRRSKRKIQAKSKTTIPD
jgi:hypothetical protein